MRKATFLFSMKSPEGHKLPLNEFALESWLKRIVSVHSGDIRHAKVDKVISLPTTTTTTTTSTLVTIPAARTYVPYYPITHFIGTALFIYLSLYRLASV